MATFQILGQNGNQTSRANADHLVHGTTANTYRVSNTVEGVAIPKCAAVYFPSAGVAVLAQADDEDTAAVTGLVWDDEIADQATGLIALSGVLEADTADWDNVTGDSGGLVSGNIYYLDGDTAGAITNTIPTNVSHVRIAVGVALSTTRMLVGLRDTLPIIKLEENLEIHVATTGNDTTGDGTAGNPLATLKGAADFFADVDPAGNTITVKFAAGIYTFTSSYVPTYANGSNVTWTGVDDQVSHGAGISLSNFDVAYSTDGSISGLQYFDMDVTLTGAGSAAAAGEFLLVRSATGGSNPQACNGLHRIEAYDSGTEVATVRVWSRDGVNALPSGTITGTVTQFRVVLKFDLAGGSAIDADGLVDAGSFESMVISGNDADDYDSTRAITADKGAIVRASVLGIHGFDRGIFMQNKGSFLSGSVSSISKCKSAGAQVGFFCDCDLAGAYINGCSTRAVLVQAGGKFRLQNGFVVGSGVDQCVRVDQADALLFGSSFFYGSGSTTGVLSQLMSRVDARSTTITGFTTATATATGGQLET